MLRHPAALDAQRWELPISRRLTAAARNKEFLIKNYSELGELRASVVNPIFLRTLRDASSFAFPQNNLYG